MSLLGHKKAAEHETLLNLLRPFHFSRRSVCINTSTFFATSDNIPEMFGPQFFLRLLESGTSDQEHISQACSSLLPPGWLFTGCLLTQRLWTSACLCEQEPPQHHKLDHVSLLILYHYTNLIIALI